MRSSLLKYNFIFLLIVACIGTLLRFSFLIPFKLPFANLLHAHSHVAFQGWVYLTLFFLLTKNFLSEKTIVVGRYKFQYRLTIFIIIGILISFIYQGYGLFSILFSSLFQIMSYWFAFRFLKDLNLEYTNQKNYISLKFIRAAVWLNILSTITPWCIGVISAKGFSGSEIYNAAIYFFLHFQYNGWFTFAVLGLFFKLLEQNRIKFNCTKASYFFYVILLSVIPAYTLSLLGMSFKNNIINIAYFASIAQLIASLLFISLIFPLINSFLKRLNHFLGLFLLVSFLAFLLKLIAQSLSILGILQNIVFTNRYLIISFLHLTLIGFVSFALFAFLKYSKNINTTGRIDKIGFILLTTGFIINEISLVCASISTFMFLNEFLAYSSLSMALGISIIYFRLK